jgi:hypothetical protein
MADDKVPQITPLVEFVDGCEPYLDALVKAWEELEEIKVKEKEMAYRKAKLNESVSALKPLVFKHTWDINTLGLSDAIRFVFSNTKRALSAIEIRAKLEDLGYSIDGFENPLANIHTAVKRMSDTNELSPVESDGKKKVFESGPELKAIPEPTNETTLDELQAARQALFEGK